MSAEIESKFTKKKAKKKGYIQKIYKDEEDVNTTYLEDKYEPHQDTSTNFYKTKKEDIRQLEEFISTKRPKDPFKDLDPLTQKVDISSGLKYQGTSQNDVF